MSFAALLQSWITATEGRNIATGLSVDEAMAQASERLTKLETSGIDDGALEPESIDVIHAMCRCLESGEFSPETLTSVYDLVAALSWLQDDFGERDHLLARLAYLAWNDSRRRAAFRSMKKWQERCVSGVTRQEVVRNFLALQFAARSPSLNAQFLVEPPVLLTACDALEKGRNTQPALAVIEATLMHEWLASLLEVSNISEEICYFAGSIAYSAAGCCRQLGRFREHDGWLDVARAHFTKTCIAGPMLIRLEWSRLAAVYDLHRGDEILDKIPALTAAFRTYEMETDEVKSILLEANALKAVGRRSEALQRFEIVRSATATAEDSLLHGMTLTSIAELIAQFGEPQHALRILQGALLLIQESGAPVGLGSIHAVTAEVLRNEGELDAAAGAYQKAITAYAAGGLSFQEAYTRLIRSDTLLASGRDDEAVMELAIALPVIVREGALLDSVAAVALLKESLRRKKADPHAIAKLRECFATIRQES